MTFIGIFSGSYCHGDEVASRVAKELGFTDVSQKVLDEAAARHGTAADRLRHSIEGPASLFDAFRRDRGRNVAYVREAIAEHIVRDALPGPAYREPGLGAAVPDDAPAAGVVHHGFATHLLPKTVSHVLRVCLVANRSFRTDLAMRAEGVSEKKARSLLESQDRQRIEWTQFLFDLGPWDERLYDVLIPMNKMSVEEAVQLIVAQARKEVVAPNPQSRSAAQDHVLACKVGVAIAEAGHEVEVSAADGNVTIVINKYVSRVEHLEQELKRIASGIAGVGSARTRLGPKFRPPGIHRDLDLGGPRRILLVDDEKEFVHTLSERLEARDLEAAIAYDGEDALSFVQSQAPEVMVLDLKMPGIDGLEVLRQVKRDHPAVEVIILTGHGSEVEERRANELGAFAYLQKPVDIELLAKTMREAYRKVAEARRDEELAGARADETSEGEQG